MTSDEMTSIPSLLKYESSDLFTIGNISKSTILNLQNDEVRTILRNSKNVPYVPPHRWEVILNYLPLEFYRLIESYQTSGHTQMYYTEEFDKKQYACNPKKYAYDKYQLTNMWRPIMILNRCPNITSFNFKYIRYYDMESFSEIMSVLISRMQHDG